jgi:hypothetical protein
MAINHNLLTDVIRSIKNDPSDDNTQAQKDRLDREHKLHLDKIMRIVKRGDGLHPNLENVTALQNGDEND